jgi:hypothetical protein
VPWPSTPSLTIDSPMFLSVVTLSSPVTPSTDGPRPSLSFAPQMKRPVVAEQYVNNTVRGIPSLPSGPPLPLSAGRVSTIAPVQKYAVVAEQYINTLARGIPMPPPPPLPLLASRVDTISPQMKLPVETPFMFGSLVLGSQGNWGTIPDTETPGWGNVTTNTGSWSPVVDTETPGWGTITPITSSPTEGGIT